MEPWDSKENKTRTITPGFRGLCEGLSPNIILVLKHVCFQSRSRLALVLRIENRVNSLAGRKCEEEPTALPIHTDVLF